MKKILGKAVMYLLLFSLGQCQLNNTKQSSIVEQRNVPGQVITEPPALTPAEAEVSGEYVKAFLVAYDVFKNSSDIPENKRHIENYKIEFRQDGEKYFILFFAKRLPSEVGIVGGSTELGRDVQYVINKKDYQLVGRNFFK